MNKTHTLNLTVIAVAITAIILLIAITVADHRTYFVQSSGGGLSGFHSTEGQ